MKAKIGAHKISPRLGFEEDRTWRVITSLSAAAESTLLINSRDDAEIDVVVVVSRCFFFFFQ